MKNYYAGLLVALMLLMGSVPVVSAAVVDPAGDAAAGAFATYDILSIDAVFTLTDITFTVNLSSNPLAPSAAALSGLYGFIDIDIDVNPLSGLTSNIDTLAPPFGNTGLGMEYSLKLSTEANHAGFVDVFEPVNSTTTTAPINYGINMFSIVVPLSQFGNDDGLLSYAVAVGDSANITDQAADPFMLPAISGPASVVPLPPAMYFFTSALAGLGWTRRHCA